MSSRRSRSTQSGSPGITDDHIMDLMSKLQALLPEHRTGSSKRVSLTHGMSADEVLQDSCIYIRRLHQQVDGLSERLARLLAMSGMNDAEVAVVRGLLHM
ncbi:hypothetical protein BHE74_00056951 [Ensete ventricosum]|uniref:Uncharacterized protein n=1 Tax=Ensete ventricosum TaxID=4639 RepID=A0A444FHG3_ENSVE|nr:hypothetical protein B296_00055319 [Ensete ventricosum]RWW22094.1 hypothetical protein GW17_00013728 [Ensete ventricosum]RWW37875.1 hypothetical protein BHE74_00056951 [Ensete ventricosum]RZR99633.1 hypothetical protein BHM03_00029209 [Ensete ventricosum]